MPSFMKREVVYRLRMKLEPSVHRKNRLTDSMKLFRISISGSSLTLVEGGLQLKGFKTKLQTTVV